MSNTITKPDTSDREIVQTRLLNAPRELVYKVWTDPEHLVHWHAPDGFTITNKQFELKPGGMWRFTMHGPDGTDYENKIVFIELNEPELLIYKHAGEEAHEAINFHVTVTFEKEGNKTLLTMRSVFPTQEERDLVVREYGAIEGGRQTLNKLEEYLRRQ